MKTFKEFRKNIFVFENANDEIDPTEKSRQFRKKSIEKSKQSKEIAQKKYQRFKEKAEQDKERKKIGAQKVKQDMHKLINSFRFKK